jgi:hypothetical protein
MTEKMIDLPDGWYILQEEVPNPWVRRYRHHPMGDKKFSQGMRIKLVQKKGCVQVVESWGSRPIYVPLHKNETKCQEFVKNLQNKLVAAPKTLGQILQGGPYYVLGSTVLAHLLDKGVLTLDQIEEAVKEIDDFEDEKRTKLSAQHWV